MARNDTEDSPGPSASSGTGTGTGTGTGAGTNPGSESGQHRFFSWMRGLGVVRQNPWIGGVCGGIAARLGIDPIIVRGIAVVVAVLGGPVFLLYAAGWLLLPDAADGIHLERLIRGVFEPAIVGIGVLVLITFLPIAQGVWWAGAGFWGEPFWPQSIGRALWSLLVIGLIVAFVIWAARRSSRNNGTPWTTEGSGQAPESRTDPAPAQGTPTQVSASSAATSAPPAASAPGAAGPHPPAPGAPGADFDAWKQQQQAWREQNALWRQQQFAQQREIRAQHSAQMRVQAQATAAQTEAARRARRLAHPRTSAAYVAIALGAALVAGAIVAAIAAGTAHWRGYEVTLGFAAAAMTIGLAMVVAGILRRRSGFLAFVAIVVTLAMLTSAVPPRDRELVVAFGSHNLATSTRVFEPLGAYAIRIDSTDLGGTDGRPRVIDVLQWTGVVNIEVTGDVTVRVEAESLTGAASLSGVTFPAGGTGSDVTVQEASMVGLVNGTRQSSLDYGVAATPDVIVRVTQSFGYVQVRNYPTVKTGVTP